MRYTERDRRANADLSAEARVQVNRREGGWTSSCSETCGALRHMSIRGGLEWYVDSSQQRCWSPAPAHMHLRHLNASRSCSPMANAAAVPWRSTAARTKT